MLLNAFFQNTVDQALQLHVVNLADNDLLGNISDSSLFTFIFRIICVPTTEV
jgi:hypothetical protein